jgi:hypothetical protein
MITILFRKCLSDEEEFTAAQKYFNTVEYRSLIHEGDLVIPRYSALPYYEELEKDILLLKGGRLINTYQQFQFIADLQNWYYLLEDLTPKTWFSLESVDKECSYVLKGATNSKKSLWNTHMYAHHKSEMLKVYFRLQDDSLIGSQNIYIREYEPFISYGTGIGGVPITKEFRFFVCNGKIIGSDFYWSNQPEIKKQYDLNSKEVSRRFLDEIIERVSPSNNFFVIDIAQRVDLEWRLVELNAGEMSGLSDINPHFLYKNLKKVINK